MWQLVKRRTEAGRDSVTGVSKCEKTCGVLSDRSGLGLWWLRQPLFSSMRRTTGVLCRAVHWGPQWGPQWRKLQGSTGVCSGCPDPQRQGLVESLVELVTGNSGLVSIASACLFRAVSRQPGSASLWMGWNQSWSSCRALKSWVAGYPPCFFSWWRKFSRVWDFLSAPSCPTMRDGMRLTTRNCSPFPFCEVIVELFSPVCCWSFWVDPWALPELLKFVDSCLIVVLSEGMKAAVGYATILARSPLPTPYPHIFSFFEWASVYLLITLL